MAQQVVAFRLVGLADEDCCRRAERAAQAVPGVLAARADLAAGRVELEVDRTRWEGRQFEQSLARAGFQVLEVADAPQARGGCC